jgi:hypothetical protein
MVKPRKQGRFSGYRINCETVPRLPAHVVATFLADPRRIPYLLVWIYRGLPIERVLKSSSLGQLREAVRLAPFSFHEGEAPSPDWVEVKRWNGVRIGLRVLEQPLAGNGGRNVFLVCNRCQKPRRALYGRQAIKQDRCVRSADWICRRCADLSYESEGGALIYRTRWIVARPLSGLVMKQRTEAWEPLVITSPLQALDMGLLHNVCFHRVPL